MRPEPTRAAALAHWQAFQARAGRAYGARRNHVVPGAGWAEPASTVSGLSPWVRHRLLLEPELVADALAAHGPGAAGRFVQEVCWRTYWKGWLEMRPAVWSDYQARVRAARAAWSAPAEANRLAAACEGRTGLAAFDAWAEKLAATGWLHNHERLWFASVWIFTLDLPWALGADLFFRRLLDGDAASNTLSWRWVAGLQTAGKHYLATAEAIEGCTDGRQRVPPGALAAGAPARPASDALVDPAPRPALAAGAGPAPGPGAALWLLHEDDAEPLSWLAEPAWPAGLRVLAVAGLAGAGARLEDPAAGFPVAADVVAFARGAVDDAVTRAARATGALALGSAVDADALLQAARATGATQVVTPYAPVGPARERLDALAAALGHAGLPLVRLQRDWDRRCWPLAERGFFRFRKSLPALLGIDGPVDRLGLPG